MCGICGIAAPDSAAIDPQRLRVMRDVLRHRGPDDQGEYLADGIGLGFRRLSILDLSASGHQPMSNEDETIWLIFNGEVYNFQELRRDLQNRGYHFKSQTDSETIIHGYEEYGVDIVPRLHGMFAFALWDAKQHILLAARDRFGKKPLVYSVHQGQLYFASEIQALLKVMATPSINRSALESYFRLQFIPSPDTIYHNIHKLPPGHLMTWQHGQLNIRSYWQVPFTKQVWSLDQAGQEFEQLFRQAVQLRLISDVPLGVFLSGGLDSAIITALMTEYSPEQVKTFSIGFPEQSHNELALARLVAEQYHTDHHEFLIQPDVITVLPMLMRHYGEPFGDSSAVATYYVAKETRRFVTVALTGDGGDENFAGYEKFALLTDLAKFDGIPLALRRVIGQALSPLLRLLPGALGRKLPVGANFFSGDVFDRYLDSFFVFGRREVQQLLTDTSSTDQVKMMAAERIADLPRQASLVDIITALDVRLYLPEGLMTKTDIATMATSLEARAPFLDHQVVSFTASLPDDYKIHQGQRKYLLRRQFSHLLPRPLQTAKKHGFDLPVNQWLQTSLWSYAQETLTSKHFQDLPYFQHTYIHRLLQEHKAARANHGIKLWSLLCFAVWHKEMMS